MVAGKLGGIPEGADENVVMAGDQVNNVLGDEGAQKGKKGKKGKKGGKGGCIMF